MKLPDAKPSQDEGATEAETTRTAEFCKIIADYVSDLREILGKLRRKLN
jgi:hypothetical protein